MTKGSSKQKTEGDVFRSVDKKLIIRSFSKTPITANDLNKEGRLDERRDFWIFSGRKSNNLFSSSISESHVAAGLVVGWL